MNKLIETIRNIFKIEELRKRILFTLFIILVYRFWLVRRYPWC